VTTTAPTRPRLLAVATACALALGACGGDADPATTTAAGGTAPATTTSGGGTPSGGTTTGSTTASGTGDEDAYVRTLEGVCRRVAEESRTFVTEVTQAEGRGDATDQLDAARGPMTRFFDAIGDRYRELAEARAPAKWEAYQASLRSDLDGVTRYLDEAKAILRDARSPADLAKLRALVGRTSFNTGAAPKDLLARTPSCTPAGAARTTTTPTP
jgi:hypothetical protein